MLVVKCPTCGARYRVPEKLRNKKAKCRKCGKPFTLAAPPPEPDLEEDLLGALAQGEAQAGDAAPPLPPAAAPAYGVAAGEALHGGWGPGGPPQPDAPVAGGFAMYLRDVGKSLLFFTRPGDLATFAVMVFLVFLHVPLMFAGCFGLVGILVVQGWFMAFRLNVIRDAAGGEEGLPGVGGGDLMEGIIMPLVKYLASWLCALGPFALGLVYLTMFGQIDGRAAVEHFVLALTGNFEAAFDPQKGGSLLLGGILLIAMLIWPMMVLVVAVGGIRSLTRFDLMMLTIVKSFPAYILVVLLAYAGIVGTALLMEAGLAAAGGGEEELRISAAVLGVGALLVVLEVYANIFTMRVIGLYYHHFKKRFAWSWG